MPFLLAFPHMTIKTNALNALSSDQPVCWMWFFSRWCLTGFVVAFLVLSHCHPSRAADSLPGTPPQPSVDFHEDVAPILVRRCLE